MGNVSLHLFVMITAVFCCSLPSQAVGRRGGLFPGRRNSRRGTNFIYVSDYNNRRFPVRPPPAAFWFRTVDGSNIQQKAYASSGPRGARAIVFTQPQGLAVLGLNPSATVYDFSDKANHTTLVKIGRRCFLVPTTEGLTFANASSQIQANDGTTVTEELPQKLLLNAVGMKANAKEKRSLQRKTPPIGTFCPGDLFRTKEIDATAGDATDYFMALHPVNSIVTLDSRITIVLPGRRKSETGNGGGKAPKRKIFFV